MNLEWALEQLDRFIDMSEPRNLSRPNFITGQQGPKAPRLDVIEQWEVTREIVERVNPTWWRDSATSRNFEFHRQRDAAIKVRAKLRRRQEVADNLGSAAPRLAADQLHEWVWEAARPLWESGNHADAVDAAIRNVNARLRTKVQRPDLSEVPLVQEALGSGPPAPGRVRLRVWPDDGSKTASTVQSGVLALGQGCFQAIRAPLSHHANDEFDLSEQEALEQLATISLFARLVDGAEVEPAPGQGASSAPL